MTEWFGALLVQLDHMGGWGALAFVVLYIIAALTMAPAFPLTLAAGAMYGVVRGSLIVSAGAVLGGYAAYAVALRLADTRLLRRFDHEPRVVVVRNAVAKHGVWIQFLLRLSPIIPFTILNYALGLARVRLRDFTIALLGMIPTILLYTYYGKVVGDVAALISGRTPPRGAGYYVLLGVGVVSAIVATAMVGRAARRALGDQGAGVRDQEVG